MNELIKNVDRLHTTESGIIRIKNNLSVECDDIVGYCRKMILNENAVIERTGKNWYILTGNCRLTVNAFSYTIITAHKILS